MSTALIYDEIYLKHSAGAFHPNLFFIKEKVDQKKKTNYHFNLL